MEQFTNYCTDEQMKRAMTLGYEPDYTWKTIEGNTYITASTTQQMTEWLRDNNLEIAIEPFPFNNNKPIYHVFIYNTNNPIDSISYSYIFADDNIDRKILELTAIDTALDYLEKGEIK